MRNCLLSMFCQCCSLRASGSATSDRASRMAGTEVFPGPCPVWFLGARLGCAVGPRYPGNVALGVPVASSSPGHPPGYPMAYPAYPAAQPPGTMPGFSSDGQVPGVHLGMSAPGAGSSGPAASAGAAPYWGLPAGGASAQAPGENAQQHLAASEGGQAGAAGGEQGAQEGASGQANGALEAAEEEANLFLGSPDRLEGAADQSVDIAGLNDMLTFPASSMATNGASFYSDHETDFKHQPGSDGGMEQGNHEVTDPQDHHHDSSFPPMSHAGQGEGVHDQGGHNQGNHVGDFSSLDGGHPGESLLLMDEGEHQWLS